MSKRAARTGIKRPGAGVSIDPKRLLWRRETALLSRAQLAEKMSSGDDAYKITPDAIAKIENGHRRPKTSTLRRLCEALNCEPEDLLPAPGVPARVPCPHCGALFGHEPGCKDAT